jgi:hypothetical protein
MAEVTASFDALEFFLTVAGAGMLLHIALCAVVLRALRGSEYHAIAGELFAVPNQWLGAPDQIDQMRVLGVQIRLLRVRYFFPFRALPPGASKLEPWVGASLFAARLAGLTFACGMLGFLVTALIEAGR